MYSLEEKIKNFAVLSRVVVIVLQYVADFWIPDHEAGVFHKAPDPLPPTPVDVVVDSAFRGLTRWDAQYFLHIAQYGYTYENTLAFFPLFPLAARHLCYSSSFFINTAMEWLTPFKYFCTLHTLLVLASVVLNNYLFVKTSVILYRLSLAALKSEKLAYVSAILFCVNPASIFFSAAYSESLYCFLVFYGMLNLEEKNSVVNFLIVGMTAAVRSNGIINLGFLVHKYIKLKVKTKLPFFHNVIFNLGIVLSVLPFLSYQLYCYVRFCVPSKIVLPKFIYTHGLENDFLFPEGNSSWCNHSVPFAYAYVQKHYWNVGFLNYYEIKQIPNFLLAAPMIYIIARGTFSFAKRHRHLILYLGFVDEDQPPAQDELPVSVFPYVLHSAALALFATLVIHVQVVTRLLASSSPVPYWFCARAVSSSLTDSVEGEVLKKLQNKGKKGCYSESHKNKKSRWKTFLFTETLSGYSFFIKWYFLLYFFVGILMFSNYFPWT